jgi:hypothetical protein
VKKLLLLLLAALCVTPLHAERPTFGVTFVPGEIYVRFNSGTRHGLKSDFHPPKTLPHGEQMKDIFGNNVKFDDPKQPSKATRGNLVDVHGNKIGTFVVAFADDFESVARIETLKEGCVIGDADHLEIPKDQLSPVILDARDLSYVKFRLENSDNYFYILKGRMEIPSSTFKRGAKSNLYNADGKFVGICTVESISDHLSL